MAGSSGRQDAQPWNRSALSPLERFFRLFTDMRPGEGRTGLLMFADVFLILCAYYLIKPLREGWLAVSGIEGLTKMELKAYSSFGQSLILVFVVTLYGRLVGRWPRATLVTRSTLFCMTNLLVFWVLQPDFFIDHLPGTGIVFYLWVGMFGVFVVAQFWAFAADVYEDERGRRLLPLIAIGATSGAVAGAWFTERLLESEFLRTEYLLLAANLPLLASIFLTRRVDRREGATSTAAPPPGRALPPRDPTGALALVLRHRYLAAAAVITLLLSWVNTNGENLLFRVVQEVLSGEAEARGIAGGEARLAWIRDETTAFYADFFQWVNLVALGLQAFLASRLLRYGGFGAIILMLPVIALTSYTAMALIPVLAVIKTMKIAENATDYSINNTARHVLWLPLPEEVTFRAKPTIDTFYVRAGDGLAALTVMVGVNVLALSVQSFFAFTVGLVVVWLIFAVLLVREHRRITGGTQEATHA